MKEVHFKKKKNTNRVDHFNTGEAESETGIGPKWPNSFVTNIWTPIIEIYSNLTDFCVSW